MTIFIPEVIDIGPTLLQLFYNVTGIQFFLAQLVELIV